jgi:hypothetical protein
MNAWWVGIAEQRKQPGSALDASLPARTRAARRARRIAAGHAVICPSFTAVGRLRRDQRRARLSSSIFVGFGK